MPSVPSAIVNSTAETWLGYPYQERVAPRSLKKFCVSLYPSGYTRIAIVVSKTNWIAAYNKNCVRLRTVPIIRQKPPSVASRLESR